MYQGRLSYQRPWIIKGKSKWANELQAIACVVSVTTFKAKADDYVNVVTNQKPS